MCNGGQPRLPKELTKGNRGERSFKEPLAVSSSPPPSTRIKSRQIFEATRSTLRAAANVLQPCHTLTAVGGATPALLLEIATSMDRPARRSCAGGIGNSAPWPCPPRWRSAPVRALLAAPGVRQLPQPYVRGGSHSPCYPECPRLGPPYAPSGTCERPTTPPPRGCGQDWVRKTDQSCQPQPTPPQPSSALPSALILLPRQRAKPAR
jgi:hypothetical protein